MFLRPTSFGADVCALSVRCIDSLGVASVSWMQMYCVGKNALQNVWKKGAGGPKGKENVVGKGEKKRKKLLFGNKCVLCL